MLGHTELTSRAANEFLILPRITCHNEWVRKRPPATLEPFLHGRRAIYCNLHTLSGALGKIKEKGKLPILLTIESSLKALIGHGCPIYDRCVRCIVAGGTGRPKVQHNRLTSRKPAMAGCRHTAACQPDVLAIR